MKGSGLWALTLFEEFNFCIRRGGEKSGTGLIWNKTLREAFCRSALTEKAECISIVYFKPWDAVIMLADCIGNCIIEGIEWEICPKSQWSSYLHFKVYHYIVVLRYSPFSQQGIRICSLVRKRLHNKLIRQKKLVLFKIVFENPCLTKGKQQNTLFLNLKLVLHGFR